MIILYYKYEIHLNEYHYLNIQYYHLSPNHLFLKMNLNAFVLYLHFPDYNYLLIFFTIFASILSPLAHESYASRTYLVPDETLGCWDMAEENGLVGLIRNNPDVYNTVVHSPITISKSTDRYFGRFIRLGDESSLDQDEIDNISFTNS